MWMYVCMWWRTGSRNGKEREEGSRRQTGRSEGRFTNFGRANIFLLALWALGWIEPICQGCRRNCARYMWHCGAHVSQTLPSLTAFHHNLKRLLNITDHSKQSVIFMAWRLFDIQSTDDWHDCTASCYCGCQNAKNHASVSSVFSHLITYKPNQRLYVKEPPFIHSFIHTIIQTRNQTSSISITAFQPAAAPHQYHLLQLQKAPTQ